MTRSLVKTIRQAEHGKLGVAVAAALGAAAMGLASAPVSAQLATPTTDAAHSSYSCTFAVSAYACGFFEESATTPGRSTVVTPGRDGSTAIRLHTEPGDSNIFGSGANERNDLSITPAMTNCFQGQTMWYAHSLMFPSDFVLPNGWLVVFDFHNTTTGAGGQANLEIDVSPSGAMNFSGYGGAQPYPVWRSPDYGASLGTLQKNVWYDFVYNAYWSANSDGYMNVWMNGKKVLSYNGPTIYSGNSCFLKLANYHTPNGLPESIIHDRVVVGTTAASVTSTALEGVSGTGTSSTSTAPTASALSVPANLAGTAVSSSQVNLSWGASTGGATGYYVYLNDAILAKVTGTTFAHAGLTAGTTYNYRVGSFDAAGNNSAWTANPVSVTTPAANADTQAPTVPGNLAGKAASSTQINLTWSASTDNKGVTGYYVYLND